MEQYKNNISSSQLSIVDGMIDWVRVVDKNNVVLYANKKMQEDLGDEIIGKNVTTFYAEVKNANTAFPA